MTLTIDLPPDLEARLHEEARRHGIDAGLYVLRAVQERLGAAAPNLSPAESELLRKVNLGLPEHVWARYHELVARRRAETLGDDEHRELVQLSDQIEEANARRIGHLAELAAARGISLDALTAQLGIPPRYG